MGGLDHTPVTAQQTMLTERNLATDTSLASLVACPDCGSSINALQAEGIACPGCRRMWPSVGGIPSLAEPSEFYYGEVDRATMRTLNADVKTQGRAAALETMYLSLGPALEQARDWVVNYALNDVRFPWISLLRLGPADNVLDLGAGWGNASRQFARRGCRVVAMDLVAERLEYVRERMAEDELTNASVLHAGNTRRLPFRDGVFSLVLMSGLLEWLPETFSGNPDRVQRDALAEARRVLRPGGTLIVGIENRYSWRYLRGDPDDHSGLRLGSLLPRKVANVYSLQKRGKPYRTYTHGIRTYRRMLRTAGFGDQRFLCALPDYRESSYLFDLSDRAACAWAVEQAVECGRLSHAVLRAVERLGLLAALVPAYLIVATSQNDMQKAR